MQLIGLCKNRIKKMSKKGPMIEANGILYEMPRRKRHLLSFHSVVTSMPARIMLDLKGRRRKLTFIK